MAIDPTAPISIIPCSGDKAGQAAPAAELYQGPLFATTLAAARASSPDCNIFVLSAKHGLLTLDQVVAPYDIRMTDAGSVDATTIAAQVCLHGIGPGMDILGLLPSAYFARLDDGLRMLGLYGIPVFEADAGIGYQRGTCRSIRTNV